VNFKVRKLCKSRLYPFKYAHGNSLYRLLIFLWQQSDTRQHSKSAMFPSKLPEPMTKSMCAQTYLSKADLGSKKKMQECKFNDSLKNKSDNYRL